MVLLFNNATVGQKMLYQSAGILRQSLMYQSAGNIRQGLKRKEKRDFDVKNELLTRK